MDAKTSSTHPLEIAEVKVGPGMGRIGITFCPGKKQMSAWSGRWERDLSLDLDTVRDWGAAAVLTLVEGHELTSLGVPSIGEEVAARHMRWLHLPIIDVTAPADDFESAWSQHGEDIRALLRTGFDILVHCKGGLGRAGTVAARLLAELGWEASEAIAAVRLVRPGALETKAQERHVLGIRAIPERLPSRSPEAVRDRAVGALMGLAIGDALGTTLEFKKRDTYEHLTDMVGGGPFCLSAGEWTDDTAMALALADSLIVQGDLDERDLMQRFVSWWRRGRYSCTGRCFDIGTTTAAALAHFEATGDPLAGSRNAGAAGNGSLMRLSPIVLYSLPLPHADAEHLAERQSATTHAASACLSACRAFTILLREAISGAAISDVLRSRQGDWDPMIAPVLEGSWRGKKRHQVSASGYVVHTLEAALWCVGRTHSFRDAVLLAANLGEDADTTAAVTGQLAGAIYGARGIPHQWRSRVAWAEKVEDMATKLMDIADAKSSATGFA